MAWPSTRSPATRSSATFTGTSAELLAAATPTEERWRAPKEWPANARAVTQLLRRQAPVMRWAGWEATELPAGHGNAVRWQLTPPREARIGGSQDSQGSQQAPAASHASDARHEYRPTQDDDSAPAGPDIGQCVICARSTRRYGDGGNPVCAGCEAAS